MVYIKKKLRIFNNKKKSKNCLTKMYSLKITAIITSLENCALKNEVNNVSN